MAYGSGSVAPLRSDGVVIEELIAPLYEDMSIRDQAKDEYVTPSPLVTTSRGLPVNQRSCSIEKRREKQRQVYKSDVVDANVVESVRKI